MCNLECGGVVRFEGSGCCTWVGIFLSLGEFRVCDDLVVFGGLFLCNASGTASSIVCICAGK